MKVEMLEILISSYCTDSHYYKSFPLLQLQRQLSDDINIKTLLTLLVSYNKKLRRVCFL